MKKYKDYIVTFIIGICIALVIWIYKGLFRTKIIYETMSILSDGCFVAGVLLTGFGLLLVISNIGNFDMIAYGLRSLINIFKSKDNKDKLEKTFYNYHMNKKEKKINTSFILHVGIIYLIFATIFTTGFYKFY